MPLIDVAGRRVTKNDAVSGLELSDIHVDFFKVRFVVRSSIDARDLHNYAVYLLVGEFNYKLIMAVNVRPELRDSRSR